MNIVIRRPIGRPYKNPNAWKSLIHMCQDGNKIEINYFRFKRTFNYRLLTKYLTHEILHRVLQQRISEGARWALDDLEGGSKPMKVSGW